MNAAFVTAIISAALVAAVPLLLASLGEATAEKSGLLNLGIEGMMLSGCFFGFLAAYQTGSSTLGVLGGTAAGLLLGLLFGFLAVTLKVDQTLVGIAITILGAGLTAFLYRDIFGRQNPSAGIDPHRIEIPLLQSIPVLGPAISGKPVLFYIAWLLVPVFAFMLSRTRFGLNVRAVGEHPFAADAAGVSVARTRYAAILIGGAMAGLAGAFLAVVDLQLFQVGMTVGLGFIGLAIAMVGGWNPWRIAVTAISFGLLRSLGNGLQILGVDVRTEFITMLPYIGIMVALVLLAGRTALPSALGVPYARGRR
jgi:general nucleoside transport system permease protein